MKDCNPNWGVLLEQIFHQQPHESTLRQIVANYAQILCLEEDEWIQEYFIDIIYKFSKKLFITSLKFFQV